MDPKNIRYKIEINPSYEWAEDAKSMGISHRELEVFALVAEGFTNKEVAEILHIKYQSVKNHMHNFNKKLGVKHSTQAMIIALQNNLIKWRAIYRDVSTDITAQDFIKDFRNLIDGKTKISGFNEKKKRKLKVWLLSHGIDVDKLGEREKQ